MRKRTPADAPAASFVDTQEPAVGKGALKFPEFQKETTPVMAGPRGVPGVGDGVRANAAVVGERKASDGGRVAVGPRLSAFRLDGVISKGEFGRVYHATRLSDGTVFALKQVDLEGMNRLEREEAIDEARLLSRLDHPCIVRYYDAFVEDAMLNIVMEYAAGGTLHTLIRKSGAGRGLPEPQIWTLFIQALAGLAHIHARKIIHRDIKTLNLFLDGRGNVKVGDLGIARPLSNRSSFARTLVGTPYYLSPELCEDKPYNVKSDVWALGVVLYEMMTGRHPFEAQSEGALIRKIIRGQYDPVPATFSPAIRDVLRLCLTYQPDQRPDTTALLAFPALRTKARELNIDLAISPPDKPQPRGLPPELGDTDPYIRAHAQANAGQGGARQAGAGADGRKHDYSDRYDETRDGYDLDRARMDRQGGGVGADRLVQKWDGAVGVVEVPGQGALSPAEQRRFVSPGQRNGTPPRDQYLAQAQGQGQGRGPVPGLDAAQRQMRGLDLDRQPMGAMAKRHSEGPPLPMGGAGDGWGVREREVARARPEGGVPAGVPTHLRGADGVMGALRYDQDDEGVMRPSSGRMRARPEDLPAAGAPTLGQPQQRPAGANPLWANDGAAMVQRRPGAAFEDVRSKDVEQHARAVWSHTYQRPAYGRRAAGDLMPVVPGQRAAPTGAVAGPRGAVAAGPARFVGPTYEPTVVSTTTAAATTAAPRPF